MSTPIAGWYPDPHDVSHLRWWDGRGWTAHRVPRGYPPPPQFGPPVRTTTSVVGGRWYFVITLVSFGLLASVPFFHAASRLRRQDLRKVGAAFAGAGVLALVLMGLAPTDEGGDPTGWAADVGGTILLVAVLVACVLLIGLRREVYEAAAVATPPAGNQVAMASVDAARSRRDEARALAARDPLMARELGIGRPGSTRPYDDGGLVDLNEATAEQLRDHCGLPHERAQQVVASRTALGRFLQVEDAIVYGQVDEVHAAVVRDRGIVIACPAP